jgi:hypothetical protein
VTDLATLARIAVARLSAAPPAAALAELTADPLGHARTRVLATLLHRHAGDPGIPTLKAAALTALARALHDPDRRANPGPPVGPAPLPPPATPPSLRAKGAKTPRPRPARA